MQGIFMPASLIVLALTCAAPRWTGQDVPNLVIDHGLGLTAVPLAASGLALLALIATLLTASQARKSGLATAS